MNLNHEQVPKISKDPVQIDVRRADIRDVCSLIEITRECFPNHIRWQIDALAIKFWDGVVRSPSSEVWIWLVNGAPAAFSHIVIDLRSWAKERQNFDYGPVVKLRAMISNPRLINRKIQKWIRATSHNKYRHDRKDDIGKDVLTHLTDSSDISPMENSKIYYGGIYSEPGKIIWVERGAVLPCYRKFGLAIRIMRFSEERAIKHGRSGIFGVIEETNKTWCWLHERVGYVPLRYDSGRYTFLKILDRKAYK